MKELFSKLKHADYTSVSHLVLMDTCFISYVMEHPHKIKELEEFVDRNPFKFGITSFNAEELCYISEKKELNENIRRNLRAFLKKEPKIMIVNVPVSPGSSSLERKFVKFFDPEILKLCPDISDAVLIAVAVHTMSDILTKDKHHIFTQIVENYVQEDYRIHVFKELNEIENDGAH